MWEIETGFMFIFKKLHLFVWYSKFPGVSFRSSVVTFTELAHIIYNRLLLAVKKALGWASQNTPTRLGCVNIGTETPSLLFLCPSALYENYPPPHVALSYRTHTFILCMYLYLHLRGNWKWNCQRKLSFNWQLNSSPGSILHGKMIRN